MAGSSKTSSSSSLSDSSSISAVGVPLERLDTTQVADALLHVSVNYRGRLCKSIEESGISRIPLINYVLKVLETMDFKSHQSALSGLDSLLHLPLSQGSLEDFPPHQVPKVCNQLLHLLIHDSKAVAAHASKLIKLYRLETQIRSRLVEIIKEHHKSATAGPYLRALGDLGIVSHEAVETLVSLFLAFDTTFFQQQVLNLTAGYQARDPEDTVASTSTKPSASAGTEAKPSRVSTLEICVDVLSDAPSQFFTIDILERVKAILEVSPSSTEFLSPAHRFNVIAQALRLINTQFAEGICAAQRDMEKKNLANSVAAEKQAEKSNSFASSDVNALSTEHTHVSDVHSLILSLILDLSRELHPDVRKQVLRFMRLTSNCTTLPRVISQHFVYGLMADRIEEQKISLSNIISLVFEPSELIDAILKYLTHETERIRQISTTCLNEFLVLQEDASQASKMDSSPDLTTGSEDESHAGGNIYGKMASSLKEYISQVFADILLTEGIAPSLAYFTRAEESFECQRCAFDLMTLIGKVNHAAVRNAIFVVLDSEDEDLLLNAARYLTKVCLFEKADDRVPALTALTEFFLNNESTRPELCEHLLDAVSRLTPPGASTHALESFLGLLSSGDDVLRTRAAEIIRSRLDDPLRMRLLSYFRKMLINDSASRSHVVSSLSIIGCVDAHLLYLMVSLLDGEKVQLKLDVLYALDKIHCLSPDAVNAAKRYMHSSNEALKDAASLFVYNALGLSLRQSGNLYDSEVVKSAIYSLAHDLREGANNELLSSLRRAALSLIASVAHYLIAQQGEDGESGTMEDELKLKDCLHLYLSNNAKRDASDTQLYAWSLFTKLFSFEEGDLKLISECFHSSRKVVDSRLRLTHDRDVVVRAVRSITLRDTEDFAAILKTMGSDRIFGQLLFDPALRYIHQAASDNSTANFDCWTKASPGVKMNLPVMFTVLAREFRASAKIMKDESLLSSSALRAQFKALKVVKSDANQAPSVVSEDKIIDQDPLLMDAEVKGLHEQLASINRSLELEQMARKSLEQKCIELMAELNRLTTEGKPTFFAELKGAIDKRQKRKGHVFEQHGADVEEDQRSTHIEYQYEETTVDQKLSATFEDPPELDESNPSGHPPSLPSTTITNDFPAPNPSTKKSPSSSSSSSSQPPRKPARASSKVSQPTNSSTTNKKNTSSSTREPANRSSSKQDEKTRRPSLSDYAGKARRASGVEKEEPTPHGTPSASKLLSSDESSSEEENEENDGDKNKETATIENALDQEDSSSKNDEDEHLVPADLSRLNQLRRELELLTLEAEEDRLEKEQREQPQYGDDLASQDPELDSSADSVLSSSVRQEREHGDRADSLKVESTPSSSSPATPSLTETLPKPTASSNAPPKIPRGIKSIKGLPSASKPPLSSSTQRSPTKVLPTPDPSRQKKRLPVIGAKNSSLSSSKPSSLTPNNNGGVLVSARKLPDPRLAKVETFLRDEKVFFYRLQIAFEASKEKLVTFESQYCKERYPMAQLFFVMEAVLGLQSQIVASLETMYSKLASEAMDYVFVGNVFGGKCDLYSVFARYEFVFALFQEGVAQLKKDKPVAFEKVCAECMTAIKNSASSSPNVGAYETLPQDLMGWFNTPVFHVGKVRDALDRVLKMTRKSEELSVFKAAVAGFQKLQEKRVENDIGDNGVEYIRLCTKKFKTTCPQLFRPVRLYIRRWTFRLVKTKKNGFMASYEEDDEHDGPVEEDDDAKSITSTVSTTSMKDADVASLKLNKMGAEAKVYLFNDAIMIACKKFGKPYCKEFSLLDDVILIDNNAAVGVFGLKLNASKGGKVSVLKAVDLGEMNLFLSSLRREITFSVSLKNGFQQVDV